MDYASSLLGLLPGGRRTPGLRELLASVGSYLPKEQVERVREAAEFGASAHHGQTRRSGEPFIAHPVAAAAILADLHLDADTIIAAILHDVIEDTRIPKDQLAARFGADVAELVDGVTKLDQIKFKSREEAQAESFRKMLLAMVKDLRVILVKLADRTHNMRTIGAMAPARRRAIARETLDIYAPIAERLGLYNMKIELEDLVRGALPGPLPRARARPAPRARQPEGIPAQDRAAAEHGAHQEPDRGARGHAREAPVQHLPEDAPQARAAERDRRCLRHPHRRGHPRHLLPRLRGGALGVQADARALQGLHCHPAGERLPVAAHHALRPERGAHRGADPHRRHAPRGRGRYRRALEVQDRQ